MEQGFTSFTKVTLFVRFRQNYQALIYITIFILGALSTIIDPNELRLPMLPTYPIAHAQIDDGLGIDFIEQEQRYIFLFEEEAAANSGLAINEYATTLVNIYGGTLIYTYTTVFEGFAANIIPSAAIDIASLPDVAEVIEDSEVVPTFFDSTIQRTNQTIPYERQQPVIWNLDRSDQREQLLDGVYHYNTRANDVHVYVIDSGIRASHQEFEGRIGNGYNLVKDDQGTNDCMGHGTHVAGTIAGKSYGIAKGATLHPVRVFGCKGGSSGATIIAAIDWVTANHRTPAVVNMSLGSGVNPAMDKAVERSIAAGITYVVAAGNNNSDACQKSPAQVDGALTVGATTDQDVRANFSNMGSCVDIFAPGTNVRSASHTGDDATADLQGTSMASPHVAGAAALYLQQNLNQGPAAVFQAIVVNATLDRLSNIGSGSPNRLLYTFFEQSDPMPTPTTLPPTPPPNTPTPTPPPNTPTPTPSPPVPTPTPGGPVKDATLYIEAPTGKMRLNETYQVKIIVDAGKSAINGVQINGEVDPHYLRIRDVAHTKTHLPLVLEPIQFDANSGTFRYGAGRTSGTIDGTFDVLIIEVEAVATTRNTTIKFVHAFPAVDISGPSGSVMRAAQNKMDIVIDGEGPTQSHKAFLPVVRK